MRPCHLVLLSLLLVLKAETGLVFAQESASTEMGDISLATSNADWELGLIDGSCLRGWPLPESSVTDPDSAQWVLPSGKVVSIDSLYISKLSKGDALPKFECSQDLLWLNNPQSEFPDSRKGWLLTWEETGISFDGTAGKNFYLWEDIRGLQLFTEVEEEFNGKDWSWISFVGGGFLKVKLLTESDSDIEVETNWGARLTFKKTEIAARFAAVGGLLKGVKVEGLDKLKRDVLLNRSLAGGALQVAGIQYPDGVAMRGGEQWQASVTKGATLSGMVGVDDEALGFKWGFQIRFQIFQDGEVIYQSNKLQAGMNAEAFTVTIPESGKLEFRLETPVLMPYGVRANWLVLRLVNAAPAN